MRGGVWQQADWAEAAVLFGEEDDDNDTDGSGPGSKAFALKHK